MTDTEYVARQLARVSGEGEHPLLAKFVRDMDTTKWLVITAEQFEQIVKVLTEGDE